MAILFNAIILFTSLTFAIEPTSILNGVPSLASFPIVTATISPLPLPTNDVPHCLSARDLQVAQLHNYYPLCNVDIPGQEIFPFVWAGNFDICLEYCDAFNRAGNEGFHFNGKFVRTSKKNENGEWIRCKAVLFLPTRIFGQDDCYLKQGLNNSTKTYGKPWIVGGVKRRDQDDPDWGSETITVNGTTSLTKSETATTTQSALPANVVGGDVVPVAKQEKEHMGGDGKDWAKEILTLSTAVYIH